MVDIEKLLNLNPKKQLIDKSMKEFGLTYDCREAGYILEDGRMLDFSGKKEGGTPKTRNLDHRDVHIIIEKDKPISGDDAMDFFERQANAVRFGTYGTWKRGYDVNAQLNSYQNPTEKQWKRIETCCILHKADVAYDVYDDKGNRVVSEYLEKPNCKMAVGQIKRDFKKAKTGE